MTKFQIFNLVFATLLMTPCFFWVLFQGWQDDNLTHFAVGWVVMIGMSWLLFGSIIFGG